MPHSFSSEELAKKFGESAEEIRDNLDELIGKAEKADKVFETLTNRQNSAIAIQDKFAKALAVSSKSMTGFGRSTTVAVRELKSVSVASKAVATSLGAIGAGAVSAIGGFKSLASESDAFSSSLSSTEKSIAGVAKGIAGLGKMRSIEVSLAVSKQKAAIGTSTTVLGAVAAGTKAQVSKQAGRQGKVAGIAFAKEMAKSAQKELKSVNLKVPVTPVFRGGGSLPPLGGRGGGSPRPPAPPPRPPRLPPPRLPRPSRTPPPGPSPKKSKVSLRSKKGSLDYMREQLEMLEEGALKGSGKEKAFIDLSVKLSKPEATLQYLKGLDKDSDAAREKINKLIETIEKGGPDAEKAIEKLAKANSYLAFKIEQGKKKAEEAAKGLIESHRKMADEVEKNVSSIGDVFSNWAREGSAEAKRFGDGLGSRATGMVAAGVAAAYLSKQIGDLAERFADAALGLAQYKVETAALAKTIVGTTAASLETMRKSLNLTRAQATEFFKVVKTGVNELGLSQQRIMEVSKALQDTFGGDQTDRLKQYVDLLKEIPTLEADLSITASMDDKAEAMYGLAKSGKMSVVADLQGAGLFGGTKGKEPGADMADAAQKTAAHTEAMKDAMLKFYPEAGFGISAIVNHAAGFIGAIASVVGVIGAMQMFVGGAIAKADITNTATRALWSKAIIAAILTGKIGGRGGIGGKGGKVRATPLRGAGGRFVSRGAGAAASGKGIVAAVKTIGSTAKTASLSLLKLGKMALKSGGGWAIAFTAAEFGLGYLADKMEETGKTAGAAGVRIAASAASIAGFAATGAMIGGMIGAIGGPFAAVTATAGAVVGALIGVVVEAKNLWKSFKTLGVSLWDWIKNKLTVPPIVKPLSSLGKAALKYDLIVKDQADEFAASGLKLEQSMARLKAATESAKFKLIELDHQLAEMTMGNISKIGGTMQGFNTALASGQAAAKRQYDEMMGVAEAERNRMRFEKMTVEARANLEKEIRAIELKAASDFSQAMEDLAEAVYRNPLLTQARMRSEIREKTAVRAREGGGMEKGELGKSFERSMALREDSSKKAGEAVDKALDKSISAMKAAEERRLAVVADGGRLIESIEHELANSRGDSLQKEVDEQSKKLNEMRAESEKNAKERLKDNALISQAETDRRNSEAAKEAKAIAAEEAKLSRLKDKQKAKALGADEAKSQLGLLKKLGRGEITGEKAGDIVGERVGGITKTIKAAEDKLKDQFDKSSLEGGVRLKENAETYIKRQKEMLEEAGRSLGKKFETPEDFEKTAREITTGKDEGKKKRLEDVRSKMEKGKAELEKIGITSKSGKELEEYRSALRERIRKVDKNFAKSDDDVEKAVGVITSSGDDLDKMTKELGKMGPQFAALAEKIAANVVESSNALTEIEQAKAQLDAAGRAKDYIDRLNAKNDGVTQSMRDVSKAIDEMIVENDEIAKLRDDMAKTEYLKLTNLKNELAAIELQASVESATGDAIESRVELERKRKELADEEYTFAKDNVKMWSDLLAKDRDKLKKAKERVGVLRSQSDAASEDQKKQLEPLLNAAEAVADEYQKRVNQSLKGFGEAKAAAKNAAEALRWSGDEIGNALRGFESDVQGINLRNLDELASILVESAGYVGDVGRAATEGFQMAKDAAKKRLAAEKKIIEKQAEEDEANIERVSRRRTEEEREKRPGMTDAEAEVFRQRTASELKIAIEANKRTALAKSELDYKKKVVDAAKRSKDLRTTEVEIQQGVVDDALSFASEFGGTFSSINALQQVNVGLARQQLDIAKQYRDEIEEAFKSAAEGSEDQKQKGLEMMRAQADVANKTLNLRRKEMGIQKDLIDRMLGRAFGELGNVGAKKGMSGEARDVLTMGIERTRMRSASGMYINVPGGKPGTIQERANQRMFGGMSGGVWGKGTGTGGPLAELEKEGGVMAEVAKALGKMPTKDHQDKLYGEMSKTKQNTKNTADAVSRGNHPGSFYTHDTTLEGLLGGVLGVLKEMAVGILSGSVTVAGAVSGASAANAEKIAAKIDGIISDNQKAAKDRAAKTEAETKRKAGPDASEVAEKVSTTLTQNLQVAKKDLKTSILELANAKKMGKDVTKERAAVQANLAKVSDLESAVRVRENQNPLAGNAGGIEDYSRVMAGKPMLKEEEVEAMTGDIQENVGKKTGKFTEAAQKALDKARYDLVDYERGGGQGATVGLTDRVKEAEAELVEAKKKDAEIAKAEQKSQAAKGTRAKLTGATLAGSKFSGDGLGSTDPRWAARVKIGESPAGIKKMGMAEAGSLAERHKKAFGEAKAVGGAAEPGGKTTGGVQAIGGTTPGGSTGLGVTKAGKPASVAGREDMAGRAATTEVAPPMTGSQIVSSPGGSVGGTESGGGIRVTGEMLVRFDNKMFKDILTPVVLQIMNTGAGQRQTLNALR